MLAVLRSLVALERVVEFGTWDNGLLGSGSIRRSLSTLLLSLLIFGGTTGSSLKGILMRFTVQVGWSVVDCIARDVLRCVDRRLVSMEALDFDDIFIEVIGVFVELRVLCIIECCDFSIFDSLGLFTVLRLELLKRLLGPCVSDWPRFFSSSRPTTPLYVFFSLLLDPSRLNTESS